jgi:hypothetical protein
MRKTLSALLLALAAVATVAAPAQATTLQITAGAVAFWRFDTSASLAGDDFSVFLFDTQGGLFPGVYTGPSPASVPPFPGFSTVRVGDVTCQNRFIRFEDTLPGAPPLVSCLSLTLTNLKALATRPLDFPSDETFTSSAPFTAVGHMNVGEGFNIVGQGVVIATFCGANVTTFCQDGISQPFTIYQFTAPETATVPEPATVALLGVGLVVVAVTRRKLAGR